MLISKMSLPERTMYKKRPRGTFLKNSAFNRSNFKDQYHIKSTAMEPLECQDTCPKCHKELRFYRKYIYKEETVKITRKFNIKPSYVIISPLEQMACKTEENRLISKSCKFKEFDRAKRQTEFLERFFLKNGVKNSDIKEYCFLEKLTVEDLILNLWEQFNELKKYGVNPENIARIYFQREKNISRFITSLHQFKSVCSELEKKRIESCPEKLKVIDSTKLKTLVIPLQRLEDKDIPSWLKISLPNNKNDKTYAISRNLIKKIKLKTNCKKLVHEKITQNNKEMEIEYEGKSVNDTYLNESTKVEYQGFSEKDVELQNKCSRWCTVFLEKLDDSVIKSYLDNSSTSNEEGSSIIKEGSLQEKAKSLTEPIKQLKKRRKTDDMQNEDIHVETLSESCETKQNKYPSNEVQSETNQKELSKSKFIQNTKGNFENFKGIKRMRTRSMESLKNGEMLAEIKGVDLMESADSKKLTSEKIVEINREKTKCEVTSNVQIEECVLQVKKRTSRRMRTLHMDKEKHNLYDVNANESVQSAQNTSAFSIDILEQNSNICEPQLLIRSASSLSQSLKKEDMQVQHMKKTDSIKNKDKIQTIEKDMEIGKGKKIEDNTTRRRMRTRSMDKEKDNLKDENIQSEVFQIARITSTVNEGMSEQKKGIHETESLSQLKKDLDMHVHKSVMNNNEHYVESADSIKSIDEKVVEVHKETTKPTDNTQIKESLSKVNKDTSRKMRTRSMDREKESLELENLDTADNISERIESQLQKKVGMNVKMKGVHHMKSTDSITNEKILDSFKEKTIPEDNIQVKEGASPFDKVIEESEKSQNVDLCVVESDDFVESEKISKSLIDTEETERIENVEECQNKDSGVVECNSSVESETVSANLIDTEETERKENVEECQNEDSGVVEGSGSVESEKISASLIDTEEIERKENVEECQNEDSGVVKCNSSVDSEKVSESLIDTEETERKENVEECQNEDSGVMECTGSIESEKVSESLIDTEETERKENVEECQNEDSGVMECTGSIESEKISESLVVLKEMEMQEPCAQSVEMQDPCASSEHESNDKSLEKDQSKNKSEELFMEIDRYMKVKCSDSIQNEKVSESFENICEIQLSPIDRKEIERKENLEKNFEYKDKLYTSDKVVGVQHIQSESNHDKNVESADFCKSVSMDASIALNESKEIKEPCTVCEDELDDKSLEKEQSKNESEELFMEITTNRDVEKPKKSHKTDSSIVKCNIYETNFNIDEKNNPYYDLYYCLLYNKDNVIQAKERVVNRKSHNHQNRLSSSITSRPFVQNTNQMSVKSFNDVDNIFTALHEQIR